MKPINFYILGFALLLLLLLSASCACYNFKPYSNEPDFAKYEGMEDIEGMEDDETLEDEGFEMEDDEEEGFEMEDEMEDEEGFEMEDEEGGILNQVINRLTGKSKSDEGMMNKLGPKPYSEDTLYDIYGPPTKGSLDCGARSAGLTNSMGPLCLSDMQLTMLNTRGGNATHDSQIGA